MRIIKNLSRTDYDQIEAMNCSRLGLALKSMRMFQLNNTEETEAMKLGNAIHMGYLEPQRFKELYVAEPESVLCAERDESNKKKKDGKLVWQPVNKRMADHKEYLAEWRAAKEKAGAVVLTNDDMGSVAGVLNSIAEEIRFPPPSDCISIGELLRSRDTEITAVGEWEYTDEAGEIKTVPIKARADILVQTKLGKTVVDIKKTSSIAPEEFVNKIDKFNYDLQAAFYKKAFEADAFIWICVGSDAPYPVATYDAELFIEIGQKKANKAFQNIDRCTKEGYWPWYTRGVEKLQPTAWLIKRYSEGEI